MKHLDRIRHDPTILGGKPCIRDLRISVGSIVTLIAKGRTRDEILRAYPSLETEDIEQALAYAAECVDSSASPLPTPMRHPGLHAGAMTMADDFDAPLPDEFWGNPS